MEPEQAKCLPQFYTVREDESAWTLKQSVFGQSLPSCPQMAFWYPYIFLYFSLLCTAPRLQLCVHLAMRTCYTLTGAMADEGCRVKHQCLPDSESPTVHKEHTGEQTSPYMGLQYEP